MEWKKNARARKNLPSCERSGHATMDNKTARKIIFDGGYSHEECEKRFKEVMNNEKDNRKEF